MIRLRALPPAEAIEFFRQKGYAIGFDWRDVWQQEHQAAFTVAKAMQIDVLRDIRAAVDDALANGETFATFKDRLQPLLADRGWWGRKPMRDPATGEEREVQLGSARRLQTIYDTNLRTAHAEGQWARIQDAKAAFPYLQYDGNNSEHPRLQHAAWDGLVLPVDDPFWQSHMPVREWGCKCRVIQLSRKQLDNRGLQVADSPQVPTYTYINKRTGETQTLPQGVHPAFAYPPGGRRESLAQYFLGRLETLPATQGAAFFNTVQLTLPLIQRGYARWFDAIAGGERKGLGGRRLVGVMEPEVITGLERFGVVPESAAISIAMREVVHLDSAARKGEKALPRAMLRTLPTLLADARAVLWDTKPGSEALLYVFDAPDGDKLARLVVRVNFATKAQVANAVRSGQLVPRHNLQEPHLRLLRGKL